MGFLKKAAPKNEETEASEAAPASAAKASRPPQKGPQQKGGRKKNASPEFSLSFLPVLPEAIEARKHVDGVYAKLRDLKKSPQDEDTEAQIEALTEELAAAKEAFSEANQGAEFVNFNGMFHKQGYDGKADFWKSNPRKDGSTEQSESFYLFIEKDGPVLKMVEDENASKKKYVLVAKLFEKSNKTGGRLFVGGSLLKDQPGTFYINETGKKGGT